MDAEEKNSREENDPKPRKPLYRRIINFFIISFLVILFLLLAFFGFSQTGTFRDYLRSQIVENFEDNFNGRLEIGSIEGTLLTSLILRDLAVTAEGDTVFVSEKIELRLILTQLIFKNILIRNIEIENSTLRIVELEPGRWNIDALTETSPESPPVETVADSSVSSPFPFTLQLNRLNIKNLNLIKKSFAFRDAYGKYDYINFDDLRISNLNLSLKAAADINSKTFKVLLEELNFATNVESYNLINLSGNFEILPGYVEAVDMKLATERTDLNLSVRLDSLDLFGDIDLENFEKYPTRLTLNVERFDFNDLSDFLPDLTFLQGQPAVNLEAGGEFGNLVIDKLELNFEETNINAKGRLLNLHTPDKLYLDILISDSFAEYNDVLTLLPELELPDFGLLSVDDLNIKYVGEPTKFNSEVTGRVADGEIYAKTFLDLQQPELVYNAEFRMTDINLNPFIGKETSINGSGRIKGRGVDPKLMDTKMSLRLNGSELNGFSSRSMQVEAEASESIVEFGVSGDLNNALADISGDINYSDEFNPDYDIRGNLKSFDLSKFTGSPSDRSNFNFTFEADGKNFNLDDLTGEFDISLDSSSYNGKMIKDSRIALEFDKTENLRIIGLESDFLDLTVSGEFRLNESLDLILYEQEALAGIIRDKFSDLSPFAAEEAEQVSVPLADLYGNIADKEIEFDVEFRFKDFGIFSILLDDEFLNIVGDGEFSVSNDSSNFNIKGDIFLEQFTVSPNGSLYYLSGLESTINFSRDNRSLAFERLFGSASVTGTRIYSGVNITSVSSDLIFNDSKIYFHAAGLVDEISTETNGYLTITKDSLDFLLEDLILTYKSLEWKNQRDILFTINSDSLNVKDFSIGIDGNEISLEGNYYSDGTNDFEIRTADFPGQIVSYYLLEGGTRFDAKIDLAGKVTGSYDDPRVRISADVRDITLDQIEFGTLFANFLYAEGVLQSNINFVDRGMNIANPLLTVSGSVPLNLGSADEVSPATGRDVDIRMISNNLDLSVFGNTLPMVYKQSGNLLADIKLTGNLNNLDFRGSFQIQDGVFRARANDLDYSLQTRLLLEGEKITVDELKIKNMGLAKNNGAITAGGEIVFRGFEPSEINIYADGNLTLLTPRSRNASPSIFGNLFISTGGDLKYAYGGDRSRIEGTIYLEEANLTLTGQGATYQSSLSDIDYIFVADTGMIEREKLEFERLLQSAVASEKEKIKTEETQFFDYNLNIVTRDEAKIVFLLSPQVNQKLTVFAFGDLQYNVTEGRTLVQGAFNLREGSKLDFFKVFDATGSIRFETSLTDPYLDVTAEYVGDYSPPNQPGTTEQVAVKLFLRGPLSSLGQNLAANPDNIAVYYGSRNIQNNIPDGRYDAADALSFVLLGKFKSDLTSSDRNQVASETSTLGNTATSFLGPVLTSFVNSAVGDVINDIQLSNTGEYTKFSVSGKYQKFRYSVGGTTQVFQNLYQANIKLEYLFTQRLLMRIERKDPVIQSTGLEDKINEIGIKYRFNF